LYQDPSSAARELENSIPLGVQFSEDSKISNFSWAALKRGASLQERINPSKFGDLTLSCIPKYSIRPL